MYVISVIPEEKLSTPVEIVIDKPEMKIKVIGPKGFTLGWMIKDYVDYVEIYLKSLNN